MLSNLNNTITFAGIEGKVLKSSPHGNFLVVELCDRITIVGTKNNKFNWSENSDYSSGFISFLTYVGYESHEQYAIAEQIKFYDGHIAEVRQSKHNRNFPLEFKIKDLTIDSFLQLFNELNN